MEIIVDMIRDAYSVALWPLGATDLNFMAMMITAFHGFLIHGIYRATIINSLSQFFIFVLMLTVSSCIAVYFLPIVYYVTIVLAIGLGIYMWRNISDVLQELQPRS